MTPPFPATVLQLAPCQVQYLNDEGPHGPLVLWRPDMRVEPQWIIGPARIVPCSRLGFRWRSGDIFCQQHAAEFLVCACGRETDTPGFCAQCRTLEGDA